MLETIEKLLILQDRDQKIRRVGGELARVGPERDGLRTKAAVTKSQLEAFKARLKQNDADRKRLLLRDGFESLVMTANKYRDEAVEVQ